MAYTITDHIADERRIIERLVDDALAAGYVISYNDGGSFPVKRSRDKAAIMAELHSTDEASLIFRDETSARVGAVYLVFGNSPWEVIADHSDNDAITALLKGAETVAAEIEAAA